MNSQAEATINHFSHEHPLQLSNFQLQNNLNIQPVCSGCKLKASGWIYRCKACNYFLHAKCSQMPEKITHPFDKNHTFSLLSKPTYPGGNFNCDACGKHGDGFSYHCKECNLDLHILCAAMPLSRSHLSHPHELKLAFKPPYRNKMFCCQVCTGVGSNHWLYRCQSCKFDVHLDCISTHMPNQKVTRAAPVQNRMPPQFPIQQAATTSRSAPQAQHFGPQYMAARPALPNFMPMMSPFTPQQGPFMPLGAMQNNDMMVLQTLQRLSAANTMQPRLNQQILSAILNGGGNSIGNAGMSTLLQAVTGGGGGGLDVLQGLLGGGGGGIGIPGLDGLGGLDGLLGGLGGFGFF